MTMSSRMDGRRESFSPMERLCTPKKGVIATIVDDSEMPKCPMGQNAEIIMSEESIQNRLTDDEYSELLKTRAGRVVLNSSVGHFDQSKISTKYYSGEASTLRDQSAGMAERHIGISLDKEQYISLLKLRANIQICRRLTEQMNTMFGNGVTPEQETIYARYLQIRKRVMLKIQLLRLGMTNDS